jgi:hypothetical protein
MRLLQVFCLFLLRIVRGGASGPALQKTGEENPAGLLESVMREKRDLEEALGKLQDEKFFIERCLEDARRDTSRLHSHTHLHALHLQATK